MRYFVLLSFIISLLLAAPAFHGKRTFTQPDGTVVEYRVHGDEHLHWNETENGDILLYSKKNNRLEFAEIRNGTLQPSGVPFSGADAAAARSASQQPRVTREEIAELHRKRRDEHLSKMKSRHHPHAH